MIKKIMTTLGLIGLLTLGQTGAMENPNNPNPDTVARIAELIQSYGFQENTPETKEIIVDALQGVMATDEEIDQAFEAVQSQEKQMPQEQKTSGKLGRELTATEKENAYKMWLMKQALEERSNKGTLPYVPQDVQGVIGKTLHDLSANPVLDGELKYEGIPTPFIIRDNLNEDGTSINLDKVDENGKKIFGDASKHLLITFDPEQFFNIVENSNRFFILIAPRFLIEEKIGSSAKPFEPIMTEWDADKAPIGIFYRLENWKNLGWYGYLTSADIFQISQNSLYDNWAIAGSTDYVYNVYHWRYMNHLRKISCSF